ncbi:MAG TPA: shikimate kinase [Tetragenococcus sp.]|nr:shikimate kinase [Tetragenococcus sp.]
MQTSLLLIGFMGAGKSTIGKLLAQQLKTDHFDLDQLIVDNIAMDIASYFEKYGEEAFRQVETKILQKTSQLSGIISTGGGIVSKAENRQFLKEQQNVVYLKTNFTELKRRIYQDKTTIRPLAQEKNTEELARLYFSRSGFYQECASITIDTTNKTAEVIITEIMQKMEEIL